MLRLVRTQRSVVVLVRVAIAIATLAAATHRVHVAVPHRVLRRLAALDCLKRQFAGIDTRCEMCLSKFRIA